MSDSDDRATPRRFEPPPWERERFEELQRKREAEEAARAAEAQAWTRQIEISRDAASEAVPVLEGEERTAAAPEGAAASRRVAGEPDAAPVGGEIDDRVANAMLMQLQAEDPHALRPVRAMGTRMAYVTGVGTIVMLAVTIANLVVFVRTNAPVYGFGAAIFATLAIFTGGVAAWLYLRAKK